MKTNSTDEHGLSLRSKGRSKATFPTQAKDDPEPSRSEKTVLNECTCDRSSAHHAVQPMLFVDSLSIGLVATAIDEERCSRYPPTEHALSENVEIAGTIAHLVHPFANTQPHTST
ncbi:hypothetical protein PHSY_005267 [Pseudozyma hubeiensis SY62]|uniref:Uncharacterized protein n=1 Tax=Pseudozyma hubeiensis (strain SY62) TaxID=1305764 RepID=R9P8I8_PSEHS|nr:hypothetical protein PHSY_005267 [Pseudozyma hubeiensis SY62]GAC97681.1 hypothetical protein PHSY_005267 [Pseudozyma hubeiensis SY62]